MTADHESHAHSHVGINQRAVGLAAALTGAFMVAELVGGILSGSLALIADAGHMLTDFGSLILAWLAFRLARRPADWQRTYGFDRFSVLAAFVNGITLFAIAIWVAIEAVQRLMNPAPVMGGLMLGIAMTGLVVNILAFLIIRKGDKDNLNIRAAALHVMGDLLGSVAAIAASVVILLTGWMPIDPLLSLLVVLLILRSATRVIMESGHILLEGSPAGFDARQVSSKLQDAIPGLAKVAHFHAWSITQERPMATLEAVLEDGVAAVPTTTAIKQWLKENHGLDHVTVEVVESDHDDSDA